MLTDEQKSRIVAATVTVETAEGGNGRAFLVAGGYLLTAAHCVDFDLEGGLALEAPHLQFVETISGRRFRVSPARTPIMIRGPQVRVLVGHSGKRGET